jgi:anti-anti-sigma factor
MRAISNDLQAEQAGSKLTFRLTSKQMFDEQKIHTAHAHMHALVVMADKPEVEIGFQDVDAVSSMALRALIDLRTTARKNGGSIALTGLNDNLKKMLAAIKLDGMFSIR